MVDDDFCGACGIYLTLGDKTEHCPECEIEICQSCAELEEPHECLPDESQL